jgi:hypothetical protein
MGIYCVNLDPIRARKRADEWAPESRIRTGKACSTLDRNQKMNRSVFGGLP